MLHRISAIALLAALAACDFDHDGHDQKFTEDFRHEFVLRPGGSLSAESFNGPVEITGWDQDKVEITGTKHARERELLASLRPEITEGPDRVGIRFSRPKTWRWSDRGGVSLRIRVPRSVRIEPVATTNGRIEIDGIDGPIRARSTNGRVALRRVNGDADVETTNGRVTLSEFRGAMRARTTNGPVAAEGAIPRVEAVTTNGGIEIDSTALAPGSATRMETTNGGIQFRVRGGPAAEISARTTNGPLRMELPPGVSARVKAQTTNGSISSNFPVEHGLDHRRRNLDAVLGSGGPLIELRTTNGPIRLDRL